MNRIAAITLAILLPGAAASAAIHVDQTGYPAAARKLAVVTGEGSEGFTIHRLPGGEVVFRGTLSPARFDRDSGDPVRTADFSALRATGRYEIRVGGAASPPFLIAPDPHAPLLRLATRSYYGQRCGTAVDLGGGWAHAACHLRSSFHPSSGREGARPNHGGWHDAGDYGRYVVNSGIATATLLWAWELFPAAFEGLDLAIPESGDAVPDLLDEVRWNLEWMLSMQDGDGGAWQKETSETFPALALLPEDDGSAVYVIGTGRAPFKSSCATANLGAVAAIAARVYEAYDPELAARAREASRRAWAWLERHPAVAFRNPPGVSTGEYGDDDCRDERIWAAAELWRTTRDESLLEWLRARRSRITRAVRSDAPPSWTSVGPLAAWTLALGGAPDSLASPILARSKRAADAIVRRAERHGYRIPLTRRDWVWGSNAVAANYALQLLVANRLEPDPATLTAARDILHWLLGRNPFSVSWVTGTGAHPVQHPHHRPSVGDSIAPPWPGLLAGGPNRHRQDPVLRAMPRTTPPARLWADDAASYSGNEIAINWNAPLVFVLAALNDEGS